MAARQYATLSEVLGEQLTSTPMRLLDWGCGSGIFAWALAMDGHEVWACDRVSPPAARRPPAGLDLHFRQVDDPVALPFDDASFDVVLSNGCLEHVVETGGSDKASMAEIARILRPGGVFVCSHLPNEKSYIERAARAVRGPVQTYLHYPMYAHAKLYTRDEIEGLATDAGLTVTSLRLYGGVPRNPLSLLPKRLADAEWFVASVDALDRVIERRLPDRCQNFCWVGKKQDR